MADMKSAKITRESRKRARTNHRVGNITAVQALVTSC